MNDLINTVQYFLIITSELTVLFLGISTLVALLLMYIPQDKLRQWLSRRGIWGNFLGAVVGSLTPFCACSTIPMTLGMLNAGAPFGPDNPFAVPIAAIIGVPLYIRAETAIPIGLALSQKGMSMGAVLALIIGGAGMAIPEMAMLASIFKKRLVSAIVVVIWTTAVLGGYLFNAIS